MYQTPNTIRPITVKNSLRNTLISTLTLLTCLIGMLDANERPLEGPIDPFLGEPRFEVQQVFDYERHPNVVVTLEGTVLATLGNSSIHVRRSEDGGKTWGEEIALPEPSYQGGGTIVDETTGDILIFAEDTHPPAPLTVYRSKDDGRTWHAEDITLHPDKNGNLLSMHMNEHGITLRHGEHAGRLIRAARHYAGFNRKENWHLMYTSAIYSDDGGINWFASQPLELGTGEAAITELSDGTLYYNSRAHWNEERPPFRRRHAWSDDGGKTWRDWQIIEILPDGAQYRNYGCFAGLVRLPIEGKDILLYSNVDSMIDRVDGTIWVSFDGGKTWPLKRRVHKGAFQYSSLAAGRPGTPSEGWIYLHFEGELRNAGKRNYWIGKSHVARFNLSWLLNGYSTGYGVIPRFDSDQ